MSILCLDDIGTLTTCIETLFQCGCYFLGQEAVFCLVTWGMVVKLLLGMDVSVSVRVKPEHGCGNNWPSRRSKLYSVSGLCIRAGLSSCTVLLPQQVCLEGEISRQSILNSLSRGKKASGDLIPWTVSEQVMSFPWHV